nr:MAG TPA: stabilization protein [Caudoviricetes sp.]
MPSSIYAEHYYINEYGERINITIPNRILSSQVKTNNEVIDSWSKFKVADYLDVDNQWGDISNLKVFKDRLFYFQDTGVGIASVNERSLVTDDNANQLVLGTGGILSRYDYITNMNGDSVINDRSIVNSDNVLYWYDYDKNEICSYSGAVSQISKEKQVQSYLNSNLTNRKKGYVTSLFDKKYNEVWFRLLDKSLIFNE